MNRFVLGLGLALLLAGCSGLGGSESSRDTAHTVTPVSVEAPATTPPARLFPPGVTADGVANVDRLARAHRETLDNRSYVLAISRTERSVDGEVTRTNLTFRRDGNRTLVVETLPWVGSVRYWYLTDDGGYRRSEIDGVSYDTVELEAGGWTARSVRTMTRFLPSGDATVETVYRDDTRYTRLFSSPGARPGVASEVEGLTTTAYLTPAGRVEHVDVSYVVRRNEVSLSFDYRAVGETTVSPPQWTRRAGTVDPAGRNSSTANGSG